MPRRLAALAVLLTTVLAGLVASPPAEARSGSSDWTVVAAGYFHSCGIRNGGRLYCWGRNHDGQLGDGTTVDSPLPTAVKVSALPSMLATGWTSVSLGTNSTCARHKTGRLYCWGSNLYGQIGDGTTTNRSTPTAVAGTKWSSVQSSNFSVCGRQTSGRLYCWGSNSTGELGDGTATDRSTPTPVAGAINWKTYTVGDTHTCAIRTNGKLYCWGSGDSGRLGDGTTASHAVPTQIGTSRWIAVGAGGYSTCGVQSTKKLYCWGGNTFGEIGDGTTTTRLVPTASSDTGSFNAVTLGFRFGCARRASGALACWGENAHGEVGDDTHGSSQLAPIGVAGHATDWKSLDAGGYHVCALTSGGRAYCWGRDTYGQLGDGATTDTSAPTEVYVP